MKESVLSFFKPFVCFDLLIIIDNICNAFNDAMIIHQKM